MLEPITAKSDKCNKSKEVKFFCQKIGTALRILEGSTQWANKAKFCVRLSKRGCEERHARWKSPYCILGLLCWKKSSHNKHDSERSIPISRTNINKPQANFHSLRMFSDAVLALPRTMKMQWHNGFWNIMDNLYQVKQCENWHTMNSLDNRKSRNETYLMLQLKSYWKFVHPAN